MLGGKVTRVSLPPLLDLYCGAGGAAMGYYRAGFTDIIGVDIEPQKRYPFEFVQADALEYLEENGHRFGFIHASPPCQKFSNVLLFHFGYRDKKPDLLTPTKEALESLGGPYAIENVPGAPLPESVMLCGSMFGLAVQRHRYFECSPRIWFSPATCQHNGSAVPVYGHFANVPGAQRAMGIDWMGQADLAQAIPPAYTEWIGRQMIKLLEVSP